MKARQGRAYETARSKKFQRFQVLAGYGVVGFSALFGLLLSVRPRAWGGPGIPPAVAFALAVLGAGRLYALRLELRRQVNEQAGERLS